MPSTRLALALSSLAGTRGCRHESAASRLGTPVADRERAPGRSDHRLRRPGRQRLSGRRPAAVGRRNPHRRSSPNGADAAAGRRPRRRRRPRCASARAAALRHERQRRRRPPFRARHRSGVLHRGTRTALQGRDRRAARAAHAGRSDDGRRAPVRRRDGALHVGHGAHQAGGGPRDRPGVTRRDRIRLWPAARADSSNRSKGCCGAAARWTRRRRWSSSPPASPARGATRRWASAGHVRAGRRSVPPASRHAASAARANVYVMQPADVGIGAALPRPTRWRGDIGSDNPLEGIEHLAGVTGGTRLPLDATGTASLLRVARESSAYYVAELEPVAGEVFGRSRRLSVRVARPGVTVRARPEVVLTDTAPARTTRLTVSDILGSTEAATGAPAARRRLHRARSGRQAARGRPAWSRWTRPSRSRRRAPS